VLVLLLVLVLDSRAQTPDISSFTGGSVTFTNVQTSMEYHVEWATGLGGTNQFQPHFRGQEYITPTGGLGMTVGAPQFFRVSATNKLSNGIYRISEFPTVVTGGSAKVDIEWAENPNGPWYTNWATPQEQSSTSAVIVVQTPRYFRASLVACASNFVGAATWLDATDPDADRTNDFTCCSYAKRYLKVKVGQSVTFAGDFGFHPLVIDCQDSTSLTNTSGFTGSRTFMFLKPGYYGYHCQNHGNPPSSGNMSGNIWVIP
jgi:plastocyanin